MGQFSSSFPKHSSYLCEYAIRFDLSCSFCEYPFIFHCLHCSPSCFDPDSLLLAYLWLGLSWIDCISANKSFSSSKTSSRKPYTSSKQQERQKHSVETTKIFSPLIQLQHTLKHWKSTFCYSPLVLWWPPLSHFQEKGILSWPFLGFHIYFKIPIVSLTQKNGRSPWLAPFCCCVRDISYRKLSAHGAAGVHLAWLG